MRGKILGISGIENFYPFIEMRYAKVINESYPHVDIQDLPYKNNIFDYVISDQVIEHVENPVAAIRESYRVIKTGGIAVHTTCFINHVHRCPRDMWRFSPEGLLYLCKGFSRVLQCEGWGNRAAVVLIMVSERFRFLSIPDWPWSWRHLLATRKNAEYPIVTWIVAQK